ncbi:type I polyketide synthase [Aquisphaera insulae]|uniref:type I polyketide synthase n=1 Tax=Aquisphaera insulae TaxID=2712864 RepID=UPI0013EAE5D0|nr:type I polyketide synthase [Aquisphaera insulae]
MSRRRPYDVAIVGMGCRFPGAADLFAYWANILANRDATREVPPDRWPLETFLDEDSEANDRVACRRGGYLDGPIPFDATAHGIMPLAVAGGEPEQFLILDAARAALDDAGIVPDAIDRRRVDVVIGRGNYFNRGNLTRLQHGRIVAQTVGLLASLHPEWTDRDLDDIRHGLKASLPPFEAATIPGQLTNATAGRIADRLDLSGASFVVDAASASSLLAVELGSRALIERRADVAIVGGVYVEADVDFPLVFSRLNVLSRSGKARPFGADADGMIPGEGAGVVILKRLADAERAGDRIYAVVKAVGLASDGRGRGLAAPSAKGHARAMRRAYRAAGIDPGSIGLIEGHGLGVPAADRAELRAMARVFPRASAASGARVLGAVASQIGHAMPAAGMAGLIKAALSLHHRVLPPTLGADRPQPRVAAAGLEMLAESRPWTHGDAASPRRAAVSAFGFAGINAHAVLEEHPGSADGMTPGAMLGWDTEAFLLAADDRPGLADRVRWVRDRLGRGERHALKDLAWTLNGEAIARPGAVRLGLVAGSIEELIAHLEAAETRLRDPKCRLVKDARGIYFWERPAGREGSLAFLFPGEGSQYPGMLADLCPHFPELRSVIDVADRIARDSGEETPPSRHLFGGPESAEGRLFSAETAVTAVFACQWAIFQVLHRLGLRPAAVAGHSSGELPALAAAGVLSTDRSLHGPLSRLSAAFRELESQGAIPSARLVAAGTDRDRALAACRAAGPSVMVAIDNCPHQVVLAGPADETDRVVADLRGTGVVCEVLPFARAYHTPRFSTALDPLRAFYGGLDLKPPTVPVYSCATAAPMGDDPEVIRGLAVDQWTRPVRFRETVEAMYRDGHSVFVDAGARGNLCGYAEDILRGRPAFAVAANLPRRSGTAQLNHLAASLFAQGIAIDLTYFYARRRPTTIDLEAAPPPPRPTQDLALGFPEMTLDRGLAARLRAPSRRSEDAGSLFARELALADLTPSNGDGRAIANGHHVPVDPSPVEFELLAPFAAAAADGAMLGYLSSMNEFLTTQQQVMRAYLASAAADPPPRPAMAAPAAPGPWIGAIVDWEPGRRLVSRLALDGIGDPAATNHTLGGRRISALEPGRLGLPVVPFAVMAEIVAEAGALVVPPGMALEGLEGVKAHRWVAYAPGSEFEIRAEGLAGDPLAARVTLHHVLEPGAAGRLVYEGISRFAGSAAEPVRATPFGPAEARPSRFTAEQLYDEQWLFHGPAMQAVTEVGPTGSEGASGVLTVRPLGTILRQGEPGAMLIDPIILDNFTHLLGCWGLDCLEQGDVIFPLGMGRLSIFGDSPREGTPVACRIFIREVERHRVRVDAEIVRPDETAWMRIEGWEDWRFYWPSRYRDVFRAPDAILVGEPLELRGVDPAEAAAVWLAPPADMSRPVWRDVLEAVQLSPEELEEARGEHGGSESRRAESLRGKVAAKEAVRRLWLAAGEAPRFPADLAVRIAEGTGEALLMDLAAPDRPDPPAISTAFADGLAVAIAVRDPSARVGIDVRAFHGEDERAGREAVAIRAAARACGTVGAEVVAFDEGTGEAHVAPGDGTTIRVQTARRDEHLWAWTVGEEG